MILFYVLVTHGPRPSGSLRRNPQATAQLSVYDRVLAQNPDEQGKFVADYARKIGGLNDLPNLKRALMDLKELGDGRIVIDNLARIFRYTSYAQRVTLLGELQEFAPYLFSLMHKSKLSGFSRDMVRDMVLHAEKAKLSRSEVGHRDTTEAREASAISRSGAAMARSSKIIDLKSKLENAKSNVTLQAVADEANRVGLVTATGRTWTRQTIKKALDVGRSPSPSHDTGS